MTITYSVIKNPVEKKIKKNLCAHLHCYNIDNFDNIYAKYINLIINNFYVIITFSIGNIIPNLDCVIIKSLNKGGDIGGKFVCINYLLKMNIKYNFILMLHSKSDCKKRAIYFDGILDYIDIIKNNLSNNIGIFVNRNIISGLDKKSTSWGINSIHMKYITKKMKLPFYHYIFPEGNCYILNSVVANYIFDNRYNLYYILNTEKSFDYSWFMNYYKKSESLKLITYNEAYNKFKEQNLYGNNYMVPDNVRKLSDGMIEHIFERIIFGVTKKLKKQVFILNIKLDEFKNNESKINIFNNLICHKNQYSVKKKDTYENLKITLNTPKTTLYNKIVIFHCGNIHIFKYIINKYTILKNYNFIITYLNTNDYQLILNLKLNIIHIFKVENKGLDCGPFLLCLKYLLEYPLLYNKTTIFLKIHTKSIELWRDELIQDIVYIDNCKIVYNVPVIFGSSNYTFQNKVVNRDKIFDIVNRNNLNNNILDKYIDKYLLDTKFLIPSLEFYKYYEPDLKNINSLNHWYNYGKHEFHRISNVNYIKQFSKYTSYFVAGTIFGFNKEWLDLYKNIDINSEYKILEKNYFKNTKESNTHAWEYFFGLNTFTNNGKYYSTKLKNIVNIHLSNEIKISPIRYSCINNINYNKSKIAFFMIIPDNDSISGGYRTLLKYINYLNLNNIVVDIYFGICWNDKDVLSNTVELNKFGVPTCKNWLKENMDIHTIIDTISKYNEIDINYNNYYIGFKCQRNYEIIIANAWQTAKAVSKNMDNTKKILYIIQDLEELFYDSQQLKDRVNETYSKNFNYYCISKYLVNYFKNIIKVPVVHHGLMGVDKKTYYNINESRENSVVIPYYGNLKKNRLPNLVSKIINILLKNKIHCYIFPIDFNSSSNYVHNLGVLNPEKINKIYNKCKVGIIFSNSNISRIPLEMNSSGLKVIEYYNQFTQFDLNKDCYIKIKNEKNVLSIVKNVFSSLDKVKNSNNFDILDEYNQFYYTIKSLLNSKNIHPNLIINRKIENIILGSGKSGTSTLYNSLDNSLHIHSFLSYARNKNIDLNNEKIEYTIFDIFDQNLRNFNTDNINIIDSYRTPIERKMSAFFQHINEFLVNYQIDSYLKSINQKIISFDLSKINQINFVSYFTKNIEHLVEIFLWTFFIQTDNYYPFLEYKNINSFNIAEKDFYKQNQDKYTYIVLKYDNINKWESILSNILKKKIIIKNSNITSLKIIGNLYKLFKEKITIPDVFFKLIMYHKFRMHKYHKEIIHSEIMDIFYNKEKKNKYIYNWSLKINNDIPENLYNQNMSSDLLIEKIFNWKKTKIQYDN